MQRYMGNNYRIKWNPKEPSSDEIRRHMDFGALLAAYEEQQHTARRLRIRRLGYSLSAVAAAILLLVMFLPNWFAPNSSLTADAYFAQQAFVNPPEFEFTQSPAFVSGNQTVDAHKGGVIEYPSGSRLVVPAAAFMNDRGKLIGGEVEVHYRELHDYVDFFVAGIPMTYDSAGLQRHLLAAGMVEIYATQNGKRVDLAPGKAIQVELISEVVVEDYFTLPEYYVYQLDTTARTWVYQNVDMVQFVTEEDWSAQLEASASPQQIWQEKIRSLEQDYRKALADLQATTPVPAAPFRPIQASGDRPTFELNFTSGTIALDPGSDVSPEDIRRLHEGTIWEILPESPAIDARAFQVTWESVRLRSLSEGRYEVTFIHPQNEETLLARPVLLGEDYEEAMAAYEAEQLAYEQAVEAREENLQAEAELILADYLEQRTQLQEEMKATTDSRPEWLKRKIINRFVVNEFGYWNCARPASTNPQSRKVIYRDEAGNAVENMTAYVINEEQNTLYRYLAADGAQLALLSGKENLLWIVDDHGRIALARLRSFAKDKDSQAVIQLERLEEPIRSEEQLRQLLQI